MATTKNYYVDGYTPPSGVTSTEQVKALQQQLGVTADGLWGPKSKAAYTAANGTASSLPANYTNYVGDLQKLLSSYTPQVSYSGPSQAEIEASLRPSYDLAIKQRQEQTATNKANIDADAAARGMGSSTWVTDVKNRQQNAEADDVAGLNASYAKELMAQLQSEKANQLAASEYNASNQATALQNALSVAGSFYAQDQAAAAKKSTGKKLGLTDGDLEDALNGSSPTKPAPYGNIATQRQEKDDARKDTKTTPYGNIATRRQEVTESKKK